MTKDEYIERLKKLQAEHEGRVNTLDSLFISKNKKYSVGDRVEAIHFLRQHMHEGTISGIYVCFGEIEYRVESDEGVSVRCGETRGGFPNFIRLGETLSEHGAGISCPESERLLSALGKQGGQMTKTEISRLFNNNLKADKINSVVKELQSAGLITCSKEISPKTNRKKEIIRLTKDT